ncbi:uncharacterized protein PFL1_06804 [Pseudozyma flocculosa PF-1]|uniref:Zn(2)-C6 fungal-type domain-containing protein n=1 Tax=Pseudozyma flocculosa PF-1 TaxID=1277687 RepID=A0A061H0T2_9BASI|nr:uncharacterized protein PFL1_06804 [Pseudozyma flocculosa PF-1]EPQ25624.1 hypothetical protein PFL1_06804 [Pseudozyma flocculosa PF-1]
MPSTMPSPHQKDGSGGRDILPPSSDATAAAPVAAIDGLAQLAAAAAPPSPPTNRPPSNSKPSPLAALADGETPAKRGSNLACLKCRAIKVRCSRAKPTDVRCKRCNRLDLSCEYKQHHRGRKPKKRQKTGTDTLPDDSNASPSAQYASDSDANGDDPSNARPDPDSPSGNSNHEPAPDPGDSIHGRFIGPYLSAILNPATTLSRREVRPPAPSDASLSPLDPRLASSGSNSKQGAPLSSDAASNGAATWSLAPFDREPTPTRDAVTQRLISLRQATELFDYFFAELNPPLALFDPNLHTVDYCRHQRPLVFSAIIATSTRFCRPDLHPRCQALNRSAMSQAAAEEACSIDHIQALITAITWKDPTDRTTNRKLRRAIGYAFELGLLFSFEEFRSEVDSIDAARTSAAENSTPGPSDASTAQQGSGSTVSSSILRRREERDRQRTWIMLCLVQAVLNQGDRDHRPLPLQIPLRYHPDMTTWYHCGGDITLNIDARLAWSLETVALFHEVDDIVELTTRNPNPTSFGVLFHTFGQRADTIRRRWFKVSNGQYRARYPMDESAVAELPYLDAHRQMFLSELHWHWSCKVAAFNEKSLQATRSTRAAAADFLAQPGICFARTAGLALDTLQLFVTNIAKPGYLRVGHDYLVICASQAAKWLFLYRDSIDPMTLLSAHATLLEIVKECSRPQYLPSGEPSNIEREAPGYLVRYVEALINGGLNAALQKMVTRQGSASRKKTLPAELAGQGDAGGRHRFKSGSSGSAPSPGFVSRQPSFGSTPSGLEAQHTPGQPVPSIPLAPPERERRAVPTTRAESSMRFATGNPWSDSGARSGQMPTGFTAMTMPYDRGHRQPASQLTAAYGYGEGTTNAGGSPAPSSPSTASSARVINPPHPAYLSNQQYQYALPAHRPLSGGSFRNGPWSVYEGAESSPDLGQQMSSFTAVQGTPTQSYPDRQLAPGLSQHFATSSALAMDPAQDHNVPLAPAVAPLPADKASLGSLVSLNAQDLSYWDSILGSDLSSFN